MHRKHSMLGRAETLFIRKRKECNKMEETNEKNINIDEDIATTTEALKELLQEQKATNKALTDELKETKIELKKAILDSSITSDSVMSNNDIDKMILELCDRNFKNKERG